MTRGGHCHSHRGGGGLRNAGLNFEKTTDFLHNQISHTLINGVYTFAGNQKTFRIQSETLPAPTQKMMMPKMMYQNMMIPQQGYMMHEMTQANIMPQGNNELSVVQADITLVGNKTKSSNQCCFNITYISASLILLPLMFTCCMWWKKIVYPAYQLATDAYRDLAAFLRRVPNLNNLSLVVIDNAFNAEKARIIFEALNGSRITSFSFVNRALDCNGQLNQADDFCANMAPIKSLNISSHMMWGEMIA